MDNAVEKDIVLANELIDPSVIAAPPIMPVIAGIAMLSGCSIRIKTSAGKGNGRPEALGPYPNGEVF